MQLEHGINLLHRTFLFVQEWHASLVRVAMLVVCIGMRTASGGGAEEAQIPEPAGEESTHIQLSRKAVLMGSVERGTHRGSLDTKVCGIGWRSN